MTEILSYKNSGVNIDAGEKAVTKIKPIVRKTFNKNVLTEIGSFGGLYELDLEKWKKPILVSSADGVGTKLIVANMVGRFNTVGQDLVNHCVNDIFVQGAHPQYFLDYIGVGKLNPEIIESLISGFAKACIENEMALIGGEMAEMPGIYSEDDFDLAGTIVGLVEKDNVITGQDIREGDVVVGFPSTGLHTNGYSLARKIFFEKLKMKVSDNLPGGNITIGDILLSVHRSYYQELKKWAKPEFIHGMAHITGGGIPGNLKRVMPENLIAKIDCTKWEIPPVFQFMEKEGGVDKYEMFRAFNMGIGFIIVTDLHSANEIIQATDGILIGKIEFTEKREKVFLEF